MIGDIVTALLVLAGSFLALTAALGVVRLPDLYTRMHASSKAGALGGGCLMAAVAVHFDGVRVTVEAVLVLFFIVLTAPVAAHMLSQAGLRTGVPMTPNSVSNDRARDPKDPGPASR
jgi:multicomponent Na+:H+ antiporter subunit G